jgi:hypothetical protein
MCDVLCLVVGLKYEKHGIVNGKDESYNRGAESEGYTS